MSRRPKIAVIGAGWAGLSAAVDLAGYADLTVFEAGRQAGGRARTVQGNGDFSFLDNGQHILLGAYHQVWRLLDKIGVARESVLRRERMRWHQHQGLSFQAARLPAPLHLLAGVCAAEGASWRDKAALLWQMRQLQAAYRRGLPDITVGAWLAQAKVNEKLLYQFWRPLVYGALNTPVQTASLRALAAVLADGVWHDRDASDMYVPIVDLGVLLAEPAVQWLREQGVSYRPQCRVGRLDGTNGGVCVDGERFDAAVVAVAPYHVGGLLPQALSGAWQAWADTLRYHAITSVYLRYDAPPPLPALMTGLSRGTAHWLIDRSRLNGRAEVAAVISVSEEAGSLKAEEWMRRVADDVRQVCPDASQVTAWQVITEKRATPATEAGRQPFSQAELRRHGIFLAGDYLHRRYPATLEAAVQSGSAAARACRMLHFYKSA